LEAAGINNLADFSLSGESLMNLMISDDNTKKQSHQKNAFSSRERHSNSRYNNKGYPQRAIRTKKFLYIKNYTAEAWPAGAPLFFNNEDNGLDDAFFDIDASPSKQFLLDNRNDLLYKTFFEDAVGKRPSEELYDIINDPSCLQNLIDFEEYEELKSELAKELTDYLIETGDPSELGNDTEIFESYPRLRGPMRSFPKINLALHNYRIIQ
ncbi:MAG: hypothetical protein GQ525_01900, partial [Draconibacterium sp.]|nr:hypothetical protein [Draconibacterium sp.]